MNDSSSFAKAATQPAAPQRGGQPESIENLELRLVDGYHRIDRARAHGEDISAWEDFWIDLLHRYEALYARSQVAA